jgi:RNA polymerase sigma-70 factor (ECF subfamily)
MEQLVERYRVPLERFFIKRTGDRAEAEDLVQDLFCRIVARRDLGEFDKPEAYVFQAAANLLRDRSRRAGARRRLQLALVQRDGNRVEEISPERVLLDRNELELLQRALLELPERTRAIFVLQRFEGLKYKEIADRLGISASSVEKHMMSAIKHIFQRMGLVR